MRLDTHVLGAPYWLALHRPWGPSPLADQQTPGAVLWGLAEMLDLPFLAVLLLRWVRADQQEAQHADADAERRDHFRHTQADNATAAAASPTEADRQPPWWETDPDRLVTARSARYQQP